MEVTDIRSFGPWLAQMKKYRHYFHKYPELGFKEHKTSEFILEKLNKLSCFDVKANIGGTGIVATFTKTDNKYIGFRADMDALPIQENGHTDYKSINDGVMHACGHDGHMAILLATAEV